MREVLGAETGFLTFGRAFARVPEAGLLKPDERLRGGDMSHQSLARRGLLSLGLALVAAACSVSENTELAEREVDRFHQQLVAGNVEDVYAGSAEDFKQSAKKEEIIGFLDAVHRKLGPLKTAQMKSWKVNYHTSGRFVILVYDSEYAGGTASEQFTFRIQGDRALLAGYHVNSTALVVR